MNTAKLLLPVRFDLVYPGLFRQWTGLYACRAAGRLLMPPDCYRDRPETRGHDAD
jgi:hypothetical protein